MTKPAGTHGKEVMHHIARLGGSYPLVAAPGLCVCRPPDLHAPPHLAPHLPPLLCSALCLPPTPWPGLAWPAPAYGEGSVGDYDGKVTNVHLTDHHLEGAPPRA